ncbi:uncharacterized protein LOC111256376 [Setaria italica]|uniref:uncharacterized protein LOC111256376 n=1 Tax=Setaria italica TaxID=4555 RepID=UPI000BE57F24|nr:uncharacterized protein LOC111256376 [Setaria italica]
MDDHRTIGKTNPERWLILWSIYAQVYGILDWRDTISCYYTETLKKVWIQNSKPYSITLTIKKLQEMINEDLTMDHDCFNLVIRKIMFDNIELVKKTKGTVSKHCLDMQF